MIIKLDLNHEQLHKLHEVLESDGNKYEENSEDKTYSYFVRILKSKADDICSNRPVPKYNVDLEVRETYRRNTPVPLEKLSRIFKEIGLFPGK